MTLSTRTVTLAHATDWVGFRDAARDLLMRDAAPDQVIWQVATDCGPADLFATDEPAVQVAQPNNDSDPLFAPTVPSRAIAFPRPIMELCQSVALHRDPARWALLYRLLWRLLRETTLRDDPLDADLQRARLMQRAVHRDQHKMKAFVRFRPVQRDDQPTLHAAWFEPEHHIVDAVAPFFMRRFTTLHWAILTPDRCVRWDGRSLAFSDGAQRHEAPPADAGEALWLTYYAHIFNPTRLKLAMMRQEIPRKYWRNLPEAQLIGELAAGAAERSGRMLAADPTQTRRRRPAPEKLPGRSSSPAPHDPTAPRTDPQAGLGPWPVAPRAHRDPADDVMPRANNATP